MSPTIATAKPAVPLTTVSYGETFVCIDWPMIVPPKPARNARGKETGGTKNADIIVAPITKTTAGFQLYRAAYRTKGTGVKRIANIDNTGMNKLTSRSTIKIPKSIAPSVVFLD